jgi:hypothetical protein
VYNIHAYGNEQNRNIIYVGEAMITLIGGPALNQMAALLWAQVG